MRFMTFATIFTESDGDKLKAIDKGEEMLKQSVFRTDWQEKKNKLRRDKSDVAELLEPFLTEYQNSANEVLMKSERSSQTIFMRDFTVEIYTRLLMP